MKYGKCVLRKSHSDSSCTRVAVCVNVGCRGKFWLHNEICFGSRWHPEQSILSGEWLIATSLASQRGATGPNLLSYLIQQKTNRQYKTVTFKDQTSCAWDRQSGGRSRMSWALIGLSPRESYQASVQKEGTQGGLGRLMSRIERLWASTLEQSTREETAIWEKEPWRPAELSPVFSELAYTYQEAIHKQGRRTQKHEETKDHSLWLAQDGGHSCSYKTELDSQWSYMNV